MKLPPRAQGANPPTSPQKCLLSRPGQFTVESRRCTVCRVRERALRHRQPRHGTDTANHDPASGHAVNSDKEYSRNELRPSTQVLEFGQSEASSENALVERVDLPLLSVPARNRSQTVDCQGGSSFMLNNPSCPRCITTQLLGPTLSNGPIDEKIFYPKSKPILQIATTEDELFSVVFEDSKSEFCLFFDLRLFDEPFRAGLGHISEMFVEGQMDEAVGPSDSSSAKPTHGQSNKLSCSFSAFGTERIDYRGDYQ
ncbi:uncharacterized protein BKA55DRAFT_698897 [Fusarium redolens]|nr:uncharacterized protein BKA55DRAFT_698897 [Fusarium redolens]KAH7200785.1 hypothetical protein BKA55DRAFT_698897 [Fusarium redolens]